MSKTDQIKKELAWYKAYADNIEATNHNAHDFACQHADEAMGVIQYPYSEGDDYWVLQELAKKGTYSDSTGCYDQGILAVQSCWDDQSKDFHREDPDRDYFDSLEEVLQHARDEFDFVKVECFDCDMSDIDSGDVLVAEEGKHGKFIKSY